MRAIQREHELREPWGATADIWGSRLPNRMSTEKHFLDMDKRGIFLSVGKKLHEEEKSKVNSKKSRRELEKRKSRYRNSNICH